jgi:hypothetical protein
MSTLRVGRVVGFRVQAEFIGIKDSYRAAAVIFAIVAVDAELGRVAALSATMTVARGNHFLILTRFVKLIVRFASFSKPWTRRMAFRRALGFAMFILRFRTHRERVALSRW